jgi:transposase-like protein
MSGSNGGILRARLSCGRYGGIAKYGVSYRDLEEMMEERGVDLDHTT